MIQEIELIYEQRNKKDELLYVADLREESDSNVVAKLTEIISFAAASATQTNKS